jgi:hypothetical protein
MNDIDLLKGFRDDMPEPTTDAWLRARAAIAAARAESDPPRRVRVRWFRPLYAVTLSVVAVAAAVAGAFLSRAPVAPGPAAPAPAAAASPAFRIKVATALQSYANIIVFTQSTTQLADGMIYNGYSWDYPWTGRPGNTVEQAGMEWEGGAEISGWALSFVVPPRDQLSAGDDNQCHLTPLGITVDYTNRTWQSAPPPCVTLPPGLDMLVPTLKIAGYPFLDGQKTIEFQSATSKDGTFTVWISYDTYLPLQSQTTEEDWTEREQYTFERPTIANQGKLTLAVPDGFTQTPVQGAAS